MKAGVSEGAARIGLMVRDVPAALLTMSRVRQLALHTNHENAAGYGSVLMERVLHPSAHSNLILRSAPKARVSKDGRKLRHAEHY